MRGADLALMPKRMTAVAPAEPTTKEYPAGDALTKCTAHTKRMLMKHPAEEPAKSHSRKIRGGGGGFLAGAPAGALAGRHGAPAILPK